MTVHIPFLVFQLTLCHVHAGHLGHPKYLVRHHATVSLCELTRHMPFEPGLARLLESQYSGQDLEVKHRTGTVLKNWTAYGTRRQHDKLRILHRQYKYFPWIDMYPSHDRNYWETVNHYRALASKEGFKNIPKCDYRYDRRAGELFIKDLARSPDWPVARISVLINKMFIDENVFRHHYEMPPHDAFLSPQE